MSASENGTDKIWDVSSIAALWTSKKYTGWSQAVAFSSDGMCRASSSYLKINDAGGLSPPAKIEVRDTNSGVVLQTVSGFFTPVIAIAFSPNGKHLASASRDEIVIRLWDINSGAALEVLWGHSDSVTAVIFSPDGKQLASTSKDGTVRI
jgi:WD40 repeat protein